MPLFTIERQFADELDPAQERKANGRDDRPYPTNHRARWAAIGAAAAVSLGAGGIGVARATTPAGASVYVGTEPCRIVDTRPGDFHIGSHDAIGPDSTITITARGPVGECTGGNALPDGATGLQLNVTPIGATAGTNLRVYPGVGDPPNASSLNPTPGQPPIPNAVTVQLDSSGRFSIYNFRGSVDVVVDVVGHYTDHHHDDRYYTQLQADTSLDTALEALAEVNVADVYTKAEIDAKLDGMYTQAEVDVLVESAKPVVRYVGDDTKFNVDGTADVVLRTLFIQVPADGTVLVNSANTIQIHLEDSFVAVCSITRETTVENGHRQRAHVVSNPDEPLVAQMSGTRGFDVSAGERFFVRLVCHSASGSGQVTDAALTAVFMPT